MSSGAAPALGSPAQGGSPLLSFLRAHALSGYFLLAYAFTWAWLIPMLAIFHQQVAGPWLVLCPTAVGFVMAGIVEGREGMLRLLRRVLVWRVGISWYLVSLLLFPALMLISLAVLPGATAAFRLPDTSFLATYLLAFVFAFFSAGAIEEFGWRGFALPRVCYEPACVGWVSLWHGHTQAISVGRQ